MAEAKISRALSALGEGLGMFAKFEESRHSREMRKRDAEYMARLRDKLATTRTLEAEDRAVGRMSAKEKRASEAEQSRYERGRADIKTAAGGKRAESVMKDYRDQSNKLAAAAAEYVGAGLETDYLKDLKLMTQGYLEDETIPADIKRQIMRVAADKMTAVGKTENVDGYAEAETYRTLAEQTYGGGEGTGAAAPADLFEPPPPVDEKATKAEPGWFESGGLFDVTQSPEQLAVMNKGLTRSGPENVEKLKQDIKSVWKGIKDATHSESYDRYHANIDKRTNPETLTAER